MTRLYWPFIYTSSSNEKARVDILHLWASIFRAMSGEHHQSWIATTHAFKYNTTTISFRTHCLLHDRYCSISKANIFLLFWYSCVCVCRCVFCVDRAQQAETRYGWQTSHSPLPASTNAKFLLRVRHLQRHLKLAISPLYVSNI